MYMGLMYFWPQKQEETKTEKIEQIVQKPSNINMTDRVYITTNLLKASVNKIGCKLDFVQFKNYFADKNKKDNLTFFYPENSKNEFYACMKFYGENTPTFADMWQLEADKYVWSNEVFNITQHIDIQGYRLFYNVKIKNISKDMQKIGVSGYIKRVEPTALGSLGHEGLFLANRAGIERIEYTSGVLLNTYIKPDYAGWVGVTDRYWTSAFLSEGMTIRMQKEQNKVELESVSSDYVLKAGEEETWKFELFVGPKDLSVLEFSEGGVGGLDQTIDYGWLSFLTKPLIKLFRGINNLVGSVALALLVFSFIMKLCFLPLTIRAQKAMSAMKNLQPHIKQLQEQHKDAPKVLQLRMLELYKEHKVNPLSGCLPVVLQLVLFFPIYRVLNLLIELRHAPFYGWIADLSAPDPTTWSNLFGLLPWEGLAFLHIGLWPVLMGLSFFVQQYDANNKQLSVMLFAVSIFMSASVPVCVTIYWTLTNVFTLIQNHVSLKFFKEFLNKKTSAYR